MKGGTGAIPYINAIVASGVFSVDGQGQVQATGTTPTTYGYLNFNASAYSSIYRDDLTTVRPSAFRAYCLIRYS